MNDNFLKSNACQNNCQLIAFTPHKQIVNVYYITGNVAPDKYVIEYKEMGASSWTGEEGAISNGQVSATLPIRIPGELYEYRIKVKGEVYKIPYTSVANDTKEIVTSTCEGKYYSLYLYLYIADSHVISKFDGQQLKIIILLDVKYFFFKFFKFV